MLLSLRDGVRVLIVTDHADRVGFFIHCDVEFCIDADRSITAGGAAAETGLTAGDFRDHSQSAVCGEECREHKKRTGNMLKFSKLLKLSVLQAISPNG